jgi:hypothetical protein
LSGLFIVRPLVDKEVGQILENDSELVVPHKETRLRSWEVYNRIRRPFEESHLVQMPIPEGFYPEG